MGSFSDDAIRTVGKIAYFSKGLPKMNLSDISSVLAKAHNEHLLKRCFCYLFDEYGMAAAKDPELCFFWRVLFDCRTGKLLGLSFFSQESVRKQLYQRLGKESLNLIPVFSAWLSHESLDFFKSDDDFPMQKMLDYGWEQWRIDAEEYITSEFANYPIAGPDDDDSGIELT